VTVVIEQLALDVDGRTRLAAALLDRRRLPAVDHGGAERLLQALVTRGLEERALPAAAALALELDRTDGRVAARTEQR
jgi:hypothetical protein